MLGKKNHICFENTPRRSPTSHYGVEYIIISIKKKKKKLLFCKYRSLHVLIVLVSVWLPLCPCLPHSVTEASSRLLLASSSLCSFYPSSSIRPKTPLMHFLTSWPWPLTCDLYLWTWPKYPSTWPTHKKSSPYVCPFSHESGNTHTDRQTDTQTMSKLLHLSLTRGVKIVIIHSRTAM